MEIIFKPPEESFYALPLKIFGDFDPNKKNC